ncbi:MAG: hypothetical protein ABR86_07120, partial [Cryomorphaceae bacterium BACL23 MAG-120924-bin60]|jgi:chemotaxis protein MotB
MRSVSRLLLLAALPATMAVSCVSPKVHAELQTNYDQVVAENEAMKVRTDKASTALVECEAKRLRIEEAFSSLLRDTTSQGSQYRTLLRAYTDLEANYDYALKNNNSLAAANLRENKAMLEQMEKIARRLASKEDSLKREQDRLIAVEAALKQREARVNELESLLARKDSTAAYFRQRIADALLGFENRGLTVSMRNGQVYVSLDNRLMFASGSWDVQADGATALGQLAKVLAENKDLRIAVEGHTDDDAYFGKTSVKDNWDLSVMRATSVVKILVNKGIEPQRVQAAGRGEFMPVAVNDSPENKARNRRTEIIITPNLDELVNLVGN